MERERGALDSFLEPIDLNQGSLPNNNNTSMDHSSSPWDNMLNPVDNQLPNYGNIPCTSANDTAQCFSGWAHGESSSSTNNMQEASKTELGWASIFKACSESSDTRSENWSFDQSNTSNHGSMNTSTTNHGLINVREQDYHSRSGGVGARLPHNLYKPSSSHSETEHIPNFYPSSSNGGTFAGSSNSNNISENNDGSPFGNWGSSCKRKALDGTSGQFYPCSSSSSHPVPGNLTISSGPRNASQANHSEHLNPRTELFYPSSSVPPAAETSSRGFTVRSSYGMNEPVPFDTSSRSARNLGGYPRQLAHPDSPEMRSAMTPPPMNPNNSTLNHRRFMPVNEARGMHSSYPWGGSFGSSPGGGSSSGERVIGARDEANVRSSRRSNREYLSAGPEIDWSYSPGTSAGASRSNASSGGRGSSSAAGWLPHQMASQSNQRLAEGAPWIPFQNNVEMETGVSRGQFGLWPPGAAASSSMDEAAAGGSSSTSRAQQLLDQRAAALLMDMPGDDMTGWRALAAVEGRHRLIRQVLTAMRRGVHLQAEDYMLVDPFINGFAEVHDRHRDMRLDVDNMSYEELLALEERIGNVNTGLSEEQIRRSMKQRKHEAIRALPNLEPCCVCQENYINGDDIGVLECGHEFHTNCIKQWLNLKNLCPICKTAALKT